MRSVLVLSVMLVSMWCVEGTVYNATDGFIRITGRYQARPDGAVAFDWSGVEIAFRVTGTSRVVAVWQGQGNQYNVFVNGSRVGLLKEYDESTTQAFELASSLAVEGTHTFLLTKRTEAVNNPRAEVFFSVQLEEGGHLVALPPASPRQLEFLGDSITCGYGVLSTPQQGPFCHDLSTRGEDNWHTYGPVTARHFGARVHVESWSGKGLLKNAGDSHIPSVDPLPLYFNRTVATQVHPVWTFARYVPQAVVINLGTNDYSGPPFPTRAQFEQAYHQFLATIRDAYGTQTVFFLVCGPMSSATVSCPYVEQVARTELNAHYVDMSDILSSSDYGCGGHPNILGHRKMADTLIVAIESVLHW